MALSTLDALADAGFDLIPLNRWDTRDQFGRERGKSPRHTDWTTRPYEQSAVLAWAAEGGNVGVRLRPPDLVIDYDPRNAPPGRDVVAELELEFGLDLSRAPSVVTGSGGRHWYFRLPPLVEKIRNGLDLFPGIEFKSVGRQVVAAGSRHPNGNLYEWAPDSPPLSTLPEAPEALVRAIERPAVRQSAPAEISLEALQRCLDQIDVVDYRGDHERWRELMTACHSASGGSLEGCETFVAWCVGDPAYAQDAEEIRYRWDTFDAGGAVRVGTLYKHVRDAGGIPPGKAAADVFTEVEVSWEPALDRTRGGTPLSTLHNAVQGIRALGIRPQFDEFRERVVLRGNVAALRAQFPSTGAVVTDATVDAVRGLMLELWKLEVTGSTVDSALRIEAQRAPFHSLREWLDALEWDGEPRLKGFLTGYAGAEDTAYVREVSRLLFVGAVARAYVPGIKLDTMTVLEGPQGCGKSSLVSALGGEWYAAGLPPKNPNDRDVIDAMQGQWIVELEELAATNFGDVESLKAFLTRTTDRARLAYGKRTADFPRQCVFVGTTNDAAYLRDPSGGRRFFPVRVSAIDLEAVHESRGQLWAEAVAEWKAGAAEPGRLMLPADLRPAAAAEQAERLMRDPWEEKVERWLAEHAEDVVRGSDLLDRLKPSGQQRPGDTGRLTGIMKRLGWRYGTHRVGERVVRGYRRVA